MSKRKMSGYEMDDEFIAQLDFLRYDHDNALQTIEQQKQDPHYLKRTAQTENHFYPMRLVISLSHPSHDSTHPEISSATYP